MGVFTVQLPAGTARKSIGAHCRKPLLGMFLYPLRDIKAWEQPGESQEGPEVPGEVP
jgi:hypothetical protein